MILVEETIRRFGYDPTPIIARGADSLKRIVRKCANCGKIQDSYIRHRDSLCNACKPKRVKIHVRSSQAPTFEPSEILVEETIARFGYDPRILPSESSRLVVRRCSGCSEKQERQRRVADSVCISCAVHIRWLERREKFKARGLSARGRTPEELIAGKEQRARILALKRRTSPAGRMASLLYATLGNLLRGQQHQSMNLPFTAVELKAHLASEIEKFSGKCPMCEIELSSSGYDVDHKIPIRTAKTEDDVRLLFRLENLSVLCGDCNRRRKAGRLIDYWTDKIVPKNKEAVVACRVDS